KPRYVGFGADAPLVPPRRRSSDPPGFPPPGGSFFFAWLGSGLRAQAHHNRRAAEEPHERRSPSQATWHHLAERPGTGPELLAVPRRRKSSLSGRAGPTRRERQHADRQGRWRRFGRRGLQARPPDRVAAPVGDAHGAGLARSRRHRREDALYG